MSMKYISMDVHKETISIAVVGGKALWYSPRSIPALNC